MAKKEKKNLIIGIIGTIVLLILLAYIFGLFNFDGGNGGGGGIITKKVSVTCDVTISNSPISNLKFSNIYCISKEVSICGFTSQSFLGLRDAGNLKFISGTQQVNTQIEVSEFSSETYKVSLCGMPLGTNTGKFEIFTDNKITDTQIVTFNQA